jgi:hypothetical protein
MRPRRILLILKILKSCQKGKIIGTDPRFFPAKRKINCPSASPHVDSLLRCAPVASFAPTHVALRAAFGRLPSQRPLACVRSQLISLRFTISGLPSAVFLRCASVAHPGLHICLSIDQCAFARVFSLRSIILPYRAPCGSLIRSFQLLTLAGLLMQSFSAVASIPSAPPRVDSFAHAHLALSGSLRESPERLPKPPGSREKPSAPLRESPILPLLSEKKNCVFPEFL